MPKMFENQILLLITQKRINLLHNYQLFKYSMGSGQGNIIGYFATFDGWPIDALNAYGFLIKP